MNTKNYLAFDSIRFGLRAIIDHFSLFLKSLLLFLTFCGMLLILRWITKGPIDVDDLWLVIESMDPFKVGYYKEIRPGAYFSLLRLLFRILLNLLSVKVALMAYDKQKFSLREIFSCFTLLPKFSLSSLLRIIAIGIGFILLVIPGVILFLSLTFFEYFILDKNLGPIEALRSSYSITKNRMFDIFILWILVETLSIIEPFVFFVPIVVAYIIAPPAGFVALGISVFIKVFIYSCAFAFFYRKLIEKQESRCKTNDITMKKNNIEVPQFILETEN